MKFACDKCSAKYTIADEKVRGKIVAVKCSKCGNKITVNGKTLVVPEEIPEERTRVASLTDLDALRAQEAAAAAPATAPAPKAAPPPPQPPPPKAAPAAAPADDGPAFTEGWHAIIDRQQVGPLTPAELRKHLASGKLTARTYVWRDGQGDWKRASDIAEFAAAFAPKPAAAPPAPPPAPVPASARNSVSMKRPAPKNGTPAPVVEQPKPASNDFEVEDRPTVQRADIDTAALAKMAAEAPEEPAASDSGSDGATLFDPSIGSDGPAAAEPAQAAASAANLFDDPAQGPDEAGQPAAEAPERVAPPVGDPGADGAPAGDLKSMLFDDQNEPVTGSHSKPLDLASAVAGDLDKKADPFSKVPDNPNISKPGEIGEQTRFFMNKAGVTRRNPPWKIALFVVLLIGLPVAVLYGLSLYNVEFLQIQTGVDDTGQEVKASVFTTEGLSSLKDVLLKKKPAPKPKPVAPKPPPKNPASGTGDVKKPGDESGGQVVAKADIKFDTLTDEQRKAMAEATRDTNSNGPKVDPKLLEDKIHVDGKTGLDQATIAEVFAKNVKGFQQCVETEIRRNPAFKGGKVNIGFTIGPSGVVTKAYLDRSDLDGTELGICLKKRARTMVFPSFEGDPFDVESPLIMAKGM